MRVCKILLALYALSFSATANSLVLNTFTDLSSFQHAASPLALEDFSSEANGEVWNRDFGDFNIAIDQSEKPSGGFFSRPGGIWSGEFQVQTCCWWSVSRLTFDSPISALGFDWKNTNNTSGYRSQMELLIDGQTFVFGPAFSQGFFGVVAINDVFSQAGIRVRTYVPHGFIDNIRYSGSSGSIPEPVTFTLVAIGLAGISFTRRQK